MSGLKKTRYRQWSEAHLSTVHKKGPCSPHTIKKTNKQKKTNQATKQKKPQPNKSSTQDRMLINFLKAITL